MFNSSHRSKKGDQMGNICFEEPLLAPLKVKCHNVMTYMSLLCTALPASTQWI